MYDTVYNKLRGELKFVVWYVGHRQWTNRGTEEQNTNAYDLRCRANPRFLTVVSMASLLRELVDARAKMLVETQVLGGNLDVAVDGTVMMVLHMMESQQKQSPGVRFADCVLN